MTKETENYFPAEILYLRSIPHLRLTPLERISFSDRHLSYHRIQKIKPSSKDKIVPLQKAYDEINSQNKLKLDGIIFHLPRSGSTLVAEVLSVHPQIIVLSESNLVNGVLNKNDIDISLRLEYLRQVFAVLFHSLQAAYKDKIWIYKTSSWNLFYFEQFEKLFPGIPCLFLSRKLEEILRSFEKKQPKWMNLKSRKNTFWWRLLGEKKMNELKQHNQLLQEELLHEYGRHLQAIQDNLPENKYVSYHQISGEIENIARFFKLPEPEKNMEAMRKRLAYDAIDGKKLFEHRE